VGLEPQRLSQRGRRAALFAVDAGQLHLKQQSGIGWNHAARPARLIGKGSVGRQAVVHEASIGSPRGLARSRHGFAEVASSYWWE
jgi:hypothetical protein